MASEMLKAVLQTEQECADRQAAARQQAEADKQAAKRQAAELVAQAQKQSEAMLAENEETIAQQSEKERQLAQQEVQKQCEAISSTAAGNLERVMQAVVDLLTELSAT